METGEGLFSLPCFLTLKQLHFENYISDFINTLADKPEMDKRQWKMRQDHLYKQILFLLI